MRTMSSSNNNSSNELQSFCGLQKSTFEFYVNSFDRVRTWKVTKTKGLMPMPHRMSLSQRCAARNAPLT